VGYGTLEMRGCDERHRDACLQRVQAAKLYDDEEQEDEDGPVGVQEILSVLPTAHCAQRNQVGRGRRDVQLGRQASSSNG